MRLGSEQVLLVGGTGNGINDVQKEGKFSNTLEWGRPVLILRSVLYYDE
jgi:hypothetical protein